MARALTDEEKREYDRLTKGAEQIRMNMDELVNKQVLGANASSNGQEKRGNSYEARDKVSK